MRFSGLSRHRPMSRSHHHTTNAVYRAAPPHAVLCLARSRSSRPLHSREASEGRRAGDQKSEIGSQQAEINFALNRPVSSVEA